MSTKKAYPEWVDSTTCLCCGVSKAKGKIVCDPCFERLKKVADRIYPTEQAILEACIDAKEGEVVGRVSSSEPNAQTLLRTLVCPFQFTKAISDYLPVGSEIFFNAEKGSWKKIAGKGWISTAGTVELPNIVFISNKYQVTRLFVDGKLVSTSQREDEFPKYIYHNDRCQVCGSLKRTDNISCTTCWREYWNPDFDKAGSDQSVLNILISRKRNKYKHPVHEVRCSFCDRFTSGTVHHLMLNGWVHPTKNGTHDQTRWKCPDCVDSNAQPKYGFTVSYESFDPQANGSFLPKTRLEDVIGFQLRPSKPKFIILADDQSDPP